MGAILGTVKLTGQGVVAVSTQVGGTGIIEELVAALQFLVNHKELKKILAKIPKPAAVALAIIGKALKGKTAFSTVEQTTSQGFIAGVFSGKPPPKVRGRG